MFHFFWLTILHWIIGLLLTGYVWSFGALWGKKLGFLRMPAGLKDIERADLPIAYPFGLTWLFLVATIATLPFLPGPVGLGILIAPLALLWSSREQIRPAIREFWFPALAGSLPGIVASGVWHGPTPEMPARYMFDSAFYAGRIQTVLVNGPFGNELSVEGLDYSRMLEQGAPHIGAALAVIPGFDPFLFYSGVAVTFFCASVAICLSRLGSRESESAQRRYAPALLIGLLMAAATKYPSWLVESPPVALALPLGFSALVVLEREDLSVWKLVQYGGVLLVALYLSKALAAVFFAVALIPHFVRVVYRQYGRASAVISSLVVLAGASAILLLNADVLHGIGKPFSRSDWTVGDILSHTDLLLGLLITAALIILPRRYRISAALAGATFWIMPSFINLSPSLLLLIVATRGVGDIGRKRTMTTIGILAVVGAATAVAAVHGRTADILLFLALTLSFFLVYAVANSDVGKLKPAITLVSIFAAFTIAMAVARPSGSAYTPAKYSFWTQVRTRVPSDGLVFTDETGPDIISLSEGSNYLSSLGEHQLFIGGWANMLNNPIARANRLKINQAVLTGSADPVQLRYSARYSGYFAAVSRKRPVPPGFHLIFRNEELALYQIAAR